MKKKIVTFLVSTVMVLSLGGCKKEEPLTELEAVQKQLLDMEGYHCTATLTRISNKAEKVYETEQYVKITGEYKLELTAPTDVAGNYTIFDGEQICQYNPTLNSKIIKDIPFDKSRNELFLNQFMENYLTSQDVGVTASTIEDSKCIVLEAIITGTDNALSYEKLWIDAQSLLPVRLSIYDSQDVERYRMEYNEFTYNPEFPENIFLIEE